MHAIKVVVAKLSRPKRFLFWRQKIDVVRECDVGMRAQTAFQVVLPDFPENRVQGINRDAPFGALQLVG